MIQDGVTGPVLQKGITPPILVLNKDDQEVFSFLMADPQWVQYSIETYVLMMNFVNRVQAKGLITNAFDLRCEDHLKAYWSQETDLRNRVHSLLENEALMLVALGLHDLKRMGDKHEHIVKALNRWLPKHYMDYCPMFLDACYEIFTAERISLTSGRVLRNEEIDSLVNDVLACHTQVEKEGLEWLKRRVMELHVVKHCNQLESTFVDYSSFSSCFKCETEGIMGSRSHYVVEEILLLHRRLVKDEEAQYLEGILSIAGSRSEVNLAVVARRGAIQVNLESLKRLLPGKWLNDEI